MTQITQLYGVWWCERAFLRFCYDWLFNGVVALSDTPGKCSECSRVPCVCYSGSTLYFPLNYYSVTSLIRLRRWMFQIYVGFFLLYSGCLQIIFFWWHYNCWLSEYSQSGCDHHRNTRLDLLFVQLLINRIYNKFRN